MVVFVIGVVFVLASFVAAKVYERKTGAEDTYILYTIISIIGMMLFLSSAASFAYDGIYSLFAAFGVSAANILHLAILLDGYRREKNELKKEVEKLRNKK